jgi:thiamine-phosphate pyrophosphorylase
VASHDDSGPGRRAQLARARLYLVCDAAPGGRDLAEVIGAVVQGGVDIVQLRDKRLGDHELLAVARVAREACRDAGALFVVNDRPDIAAAVDADGVHLGQADMPVHRARRVVGAERLIGRSTHTTEQVKRTASVDYIGVGPVYGTPTKPGRPAVGVELVRHAAEHATVPFFAIGGIDTTNVGDVVAAGAQRIAVVRAITEAEDPGAAASALRDTLHGFFPSFIAETASGPAEP